MTAPATKLETNWENSLTLPDSRPIYEWAADIELPGAYAVPGGFDASKVPFVKEPFYALANPIVREVIAQSGVQCLKTLEGEIWLLWSIVENPGPSQWLQTNDDDAKKHCEERFNALMEGCPKVKALYSNNVHEKKITSIIFKHMFLRMEGANNLRNLQRKSIKNQFCSEVWQWPKGRLSEAKARLTQFVHNSKRYIESQAGWADDDMDEAFKSGDQNYWSFRCIGCGHIQPWEWSVYRQDGSRAGMRWEDSPKTRRENGEWRWGELLPTIRYECIKCGHGHIDDTRTRYLMNSTGLYVPKNPDAPAKTKSFSWNQLTMENLTWFSQVEKFHLANAQAKLGNDIPLTEFFQKVLAQPHDPTRFFKLNPPQVIEIETEWADEFLRPMTVDVQEDSFWVVVAMMAKTGEIRIMWAGQLLTWNDVRAKQLEFKVYDGQVYVDCSDQTRAVYAQCIRHGHLEVVGNKEVWISWRGLNGDARKSFPFFQRSNGNSTKIELPYSWPESYGDPLSGQSGAGGRMCPFVHWSNPTIKDILARIRDGKGAPLKVYDGIGEEWSKQMWSERRIQVYNKWNAAEWKWEKIGKRDNHLWDCMCMMIVIACMAGIIGEVMPENKPQTEVQP